MTTKAGTPYSKSPFGGKDPEFWQQILDELNGAKAKEDAFAYQRQRLKPDVTNRNPYQMLGVTQSASAADIKAAYRRLAKRYHPDTGGDHETFLRIQAAYQQLMREHHV